jgi:hypothetical protein
LRGPKSEKNGVRGNTWVGIDFLPKSEKFQNESEKNTKKTLRNTKSTHKTSLPCHALARPLGKLTRVSFLRREDGNDLFFYVGNFRGIKRSKTGRNFPSFDPKTLGVVFGPDRGYPGVPPKTLVLDPKKVRFLGVQKSDFLSKKNAKKNYPKK